MTEINAEIKRWFVERTAQNPDYIEQVYLPALERNMRKAEYALHQALRTDSIEKIKYQMGWFDGVHEVVALLGGLRISEGKQPIEPGLIARMLSIGRNKRTDTPSEMG